MNIYIAGPYSHRAELLDRANDLVAASHGRITITSTWLQGTHEAKEHTATIAEMAAWGAVDLIDIDAADLLVQCIEWPSTRGSAHMEFMYASCHLDIPTIVCGTDLNPFHAYEIVYGQCVHAHNWTTARAWLLERAED